MDFRDSCKQFADRVAALKEQILTEEATKNAFIMPFIQMLGYDVFNPMEVVPELDCDIVKKKGEKIDYAIFKNGEPIILIECKHWKQDLSLHDTQLQRYYVANKARFGILTNGIIYKFYTDLEKPNIMDTKPFLEVNMEEGKEAQFEELKKFHKSYFDIDTILTAASELKYLYEIRRVIKSEASEPSPELIRLLTKRIYDGVVNQKIIEQFAELIKRALSMYISDVISEKLNIAINTPEPKKGIETPAVNEFLENEAELSKVITTDDELEAFYIVRAILCNNIAINRITYRDAQSYFAIFVDDNNRKPICRIRFNSATTKYIGLFDDDKNETKHRIETIEDIYNFQEELRATVHKYI